MLTVCESQVDLERALSFVETVSFITGITRTTIETTVKTATCSHERDYILTIIYAVSSVATVKCRPRILRF